MTTRNFSFFAIGLIVYATVVFLWGETLNFNLPINHEKIANYATVIGAIGSTIAMLFLAKQLIEMELARKSTYRPMLVPDKVKLSVYKPRDPHYGPNYVVFRLITSENGVRKNSHPGIPLFNIGKGMAKNIEIKWTIDLEEVEKFTSKVYIPDELPSWAPKQEIAFIEESKFKTFVLPTAFLICLDPDLREYKGPPKPNLEMNISYEDIAGEPQKDITYYVYAVTLWDTDMDPDILIEFRHTKLSPAELDSLE